MEEKKKPQQRTIESRNRLIKAAYELFNEKGYYNTNTKEIAEKAGISIGNFYNYFFDKSEVFCLLLQIHFENSAAEFASVKDEFIKTQDREVIKQGLFLWTSKMLERSSQNAGFLSDIATVSKENEKVRQQTKEGVGKLISLFEEFLHNNSDKDDCYIRARMLYTITESAASDILTIDDMAQREAYIKLLCDDIMHNIYG